MKCNCVAASKAPICPTAHLSHPWVEEGRAKVMGLVGIEPVFLHRLLQAVDFYRLLQVDTL